MEAKTIIVVPCYNEAKRLTCDAFLQSAVDHHVEWMFVDDGSRDNTAEVLTGLCQRLGKAGSLLRLRPNRGKGEAVRRGMLQALRDGAVITGYFDADLSTPPEELLRLIRVLEEDTKAVALGSRVRLLGMDIARSTGRHLLGRVFATCASFLLRMPVYDTQCGAKAFRRIPALEAALEEPFLSRWAFDVELLGRLAIGTATTPALPMAGFVEVPLKQWHDVAGSRLGLRDYPCIVRDLVRIWRDLNRRRALRNR